MTNFDIRISIPRLRTSSMDKGLARGEEDVMKIIFSFAEYIKYLYLKLVYEESESNRYKGGWEPISDPAYRDYLGTDPKRSLLELVEESLEVRKVGYNILIRVSPYKRYPRSNLTIIRVMRALEYGTSDFPARPIFYKASRSIQLNLTSLWRGFLMMKGVI